MSNIDERPEPHDGATDNTRRQPPAPTRDQAEEIAALTTGAERPVLREEFIGTEEQRVAFYTDFIKAQGAFDEIKTNKEGKIAYKAKGDREAGSFKFKYADLWQIIGATRKHLSENNIGVLQPLVEHRGSLGLKTILIHAKGGRMECTIELLLGGLIDPKDQAGVVSYWRRYVITAWLWLAADEDIDGQTKEVPDKLIVDAYLAAESGTEVYREFWRSRDDETRGLLESRHEKLKGVAVAADEATR